MSQLQDKISTLKKSFDGEIFTDKSTRLMYATDASAYREIPLAVAYPKTKSDIKTLINFARVNNASIIPRTAGTSLAGQVVGNGIIADVSKHMTRIIEINKEENWVLVEPGVILDELNLILKEYGLFFGPETSTSNRCMIGGMVGNNACGSHSLIYGSTRDHTIEIDTILSDGSEAVFKPLSIEEFQSKTDGDTLENKIYRGIDEILSDIDNQLEIKNEFPDLKLRRRNTGYAIDLILEMQPFNPKGEQFNFSGLLAGSEGTLSFTTAIKLNLLPLPPANKALVCVHFDSIKNALKANLIALKHKPVAVELMDSTILELTKKNIAQDKNRFFITGEPGAILIVEFAEDNPEIIKAKAKAMEVEMKQADLGFHFPMVEGHDINKVWELRKAGLGILNNMPGDAKPVAVIEDTAINPELLPDYIDEFDKILKKYNKNCVYYAHIATGELHLRPILNLKDPVDVELFHTLAKETAELVKKYRGSLSGEHGDGRLRGEFIPIMVGDHNYQLFKQIKHTWDPHNIFNPGKIVDTPKMNTFLRYEPGQQTREIETVFDFSKDLGILRATEKCNGTGACRKTEVFGGTMCPSYMVSRNESQTTRARANILREFLTNSNKTNPFNHKEIYDVMDMCLSCKACKSECPSSVDITKLKAEFLQHYYSEHHIPIRTLLIANIAKLNKIGSYFPPLYNFLTQNSIISKITTKFIGFTSKRKFPLLSKITLDSWFINAKKDLSKKSFPNGRVHLFNDEFTRFNDADIGIKAILLLTKLGYEVVIPKHVESARTYLSKGLVKKAKTIANRNIILLKSIISKQSPLVGIEPSTILTFRDEYIDLACLELINDAEVLAGNSFMIEEFLEREIKAGKITKEQFTDKKKHIKFHGHCHQKSLSGTSSTLFVLNFPCNYTAEEIPSGCCGMAGSFGFENEHYEMSMKVGELVLFPAVRECNTNTIIAAPGTSCRQQIKDGTARDALHPVEILWEACI
ncbi:MAG: FAD-binding protein [Bacteroidetes bacterium]|nr:FAD-binding protein [Bacteroidota bacterium]MBL6944353.1 FAD-binding protein [Bacteroidales bacterium]